jgi:AsmA family protein
MACSAVGIGPATCLAIGPGRGYGRGVGFVPRLAFGDSSLLRRALISVAGVVAFMILMITAIALALESGYFRGPLIRYFASVSGRPLAVDGSIKLRILSLHPRVIAERLSIGNPAWMPPGTTAEIGKFTLVMTIPWFGQSFAVENLEMEGATLHLQRDAEGHSNWRRNPPGIRGNGGLPIIRRFSMLSAHVELDDARRHLQFQGTVSAHEGDARGAPAPGVVTPSAPASGAVAPAALRPLRIEGEGQLNGRPATFEIEGAPLAAANRATPYHFSFTERSGDSRLSGSGSLPKPFDFTELDTAFEAVGVDLKDLYFLTGVTLVHTGGYHLTGNLARRGRISEFRDLAITSGKSDLRGSVTIETTKGRPDFHAELNSQLLRLADVGARAAAGAAPPGAKATGAPNSSDPPLLLSDASLKPSTIRRGDGVVDFHVRRLEGSHLSVEAVSARMVIDKGVLVLAPLTGNVLEGKFVARVRLDATTDTPAADVDLKITDLQIAQLFHKSTAPPPMEGLMRARITLKGHGSSVHQVAASSNGTVTAVLPHGSLRAALAELTGIDLRGLGLLIAKSERQTAVHCGVASFRADDGTLKAQSLVLDTDAVLITGDGSVHLDSEAVDLVLHGHPKGVRLMRLRAPVLVRGTLAHPSPGIQMGNAAAQGAGALALGIVLTPLASVLAFVDPGLAKDADCAALLAPKTLDAPPPVSANH